MTVLFLLLVLAASFGATGGLRRYALARHLMDVPNERSSHSVPTPRGGGVAFVLCFLGVIGLGWVRGALADAEALAYLGAGGGVAVLGFLDDHGHIAARWRLLGHFAAAGWALFWLGLPALSFLGLTIESAWVVGPLYLLALVWLLNLYNFMDGIDGIAGVEAITVCLGGALALVLVGHPDQALLCLLLAAAVGGFLAWNFPPAKIFMGDAGSGFLGLVLGLLALQSSQHEPRLTWVWLILLGVFVVDATVTLIRRLLRGEKVYEAHRSHAYQFASRRVGSHRPVTLTVLAINLLWLMPIALSVAMDCLDGVMALVLAYLPLIILAWKLRAGEREHGR